MDLLDKIGKGLGSGFKVGEEIVGLQTRAMLDLFGGETERERIKKRAEETEESISNFSKTVSAAYHGRPLPSEIAKIAEKRRIAAEDGAFANRGKARQELGPTPYQPDLGEFQLAPEQTLQEKVETSVEAPKTQRPQVAKVEVKDQEPVFKEKAEEAPINMQEKIENEEEAAYQKRIGQTEETTGLDFDELSKASDAKKDYLTTEEGVDDDGIFLSIAKGLGRGLLEAARPFVGFAFNPIEDAILQHLTDYEDPYNPITQQRAAGRRAYADAVFNAETKDLSRAFDIFRLMTMETQGRQIAAAEVKEKSQYTLNLLATKIYQGEKLSSGEDAMWRSYTGTTQEQHKFLLDHNEQLAKFTERQHKLSIAMQEHQALISKKIMDMGELPQELRSIYMNKLNTLGYAGNPGNPMACAEYMNTVNALCGGRQVMDMEDAQRALLSLQKINANATQYQQSMADDVNKEIAAIEKDYRAYCSHLAEYSNTPPAEEEALKKQWRTEAFQNNAILSNYANVVGGISTNPASQAWVTGFRNGSPSLVYPGINQKGRSFDFSDLPNKDKVEAQTKELVTGVMASLGEEIVDTKRARGRITTALMMNTMVPYEGRSVTLKEFLELGNDFTPEIQKLAVKAVQALVPQLTGRSTQ